MSKESSMGLGLFSHLSTPCFLAFLFDGVNLLGFTRFSMMMAMSVSYAVIASASPRSMSRWFKCQVDPLQCSLHGIWEQQNVLCHHTPSSPPFSRSFWNSSNLSLVLTNSNYFVSSANIITLGSCQLEKDQPTLTFMFFLSIHSRSPLKYRAKETFCLTSAAILTVSKSPIVTIILSY